ncbi:hypothetical protein BLNAU_22214 [Blattamonas nauphoetae]|uniref:Uncharacterized protein n=1 Tax=Blattamonas nauphoetae TaxID=2049346 RepID=A0ABQ9WTR5_9EUKA|nr:hypothetical protein BLNAU_22214 [Blattamonas nauphoetae]
MKSHDCATSDDFSSNQPTEHILAPCSSMKIGGGHRIDKSLTEGIGEPSSRTGMVNVAEKSAAPSLSVPTSSSNTTFHLLHCLFIAKFPSTNSLFAVDTTELSTRVHRQIVMNGS